MPDKNKNRDWLDYVIKIAFICVMAFFSFALYKSYALKTNAIPAAEETPLATAALPASTNVPLAETAAKTFEPIVIIEPTIIKEIIVVEVEKEPPTATSENHTFSFSFTFDSSVVEKAADGAIKGLQSIDFKKIGEKISGAFRKN